MSYPACRRAAFVNAILILLLMTSALTVQHGRRVAAAAPTRPEDAGAYDVVIETSQAGGGSTWRYTITKAANDAKDLGHFIVNFNKVIFIQVV